MNVQDMTNAEVYERTLQVLIEHLGLDGTTRFLSICKPRKSQTSVVGQQLPRSVMESIQERVYGTYAALQFVPNNENIRNLDKLSDTAFNEIGRHSQQDAEYLTLAEQVHLSAEDLSPSTPHIHKINPTCNENGTDEQMERQFIS